MVNMIIDGKHVSAEENITIMEAAERNGIPIPKLCYLKGINEIAACRVCCVEVEGERAMVTACNNPVKEGMVVHTNSPRVRTTRRINVELILSQHDCKCATCVRSGNCQLQTIANDLTQAVHVQHIHLLSLRHDGRADSFPVQLAVLRVMVQQFLQAALLDLRFQGVQLRVHGLLFLVQHDRTVHQFFVTQFANH